MKRFRFPNKTATFNVPVMVPLEVGRKLEQAIEYVVEKHGESKTASIRIEVTVIRSSVFEQTLATVIYEKDVRSRKKNR